MLYEVVVMEDGAPLFGPVTVAARDSLAAALKMMLIPGRPQFDVDSVTVMICERGGAQTVLESRKSLFLVEDPLLRQRA